MICVHRWQYVKPWPWKEVFHGGGEELHEGGEYWCSLCGERKLMAYPMPMVEEPDRW